VCTGALLLARTGLLHQRRATTHWGALDQLARIDPTIVVQPNARVVDDGPITSAGISAGIDMSLAVVARLHGQAVAADTARYMDYGRAGVSSTADSPTTA
jgi:transcriptional regulator GlxA family with amidase domain